MLILIAITVVSCFHNSIGIHDDFIYLSDTGDDITPKNIVYDVKDAETLFENFIQEHNKEYKDDAEFQHRYGIFMKNLVRINEMNEKSRSAIYGITQFTDMTVEELYEGYTGLANITLDSDIRYPSRIILDDVEAPDEFDWRKKNVVTPVGDQRRCGSCWAFSAVGLVEGQHAIKHGKLISLSEQELVDCWTPGGGCILGSYPHWALNGVSKMGGFMKLSDYPYKGVQGDCVFRKESVVVKVRSGTQQNVTDEEQLKKMLYKFGPLSIGIHGDEKLFSYKGNVYIPTKEECPPYCHANHAVLLVGYGTDKGTPYWIIKNSWGQKWGENGYLRIIRGENACAIPTYVATGEVF